MPETTPPQQLRDAMYGAGDLSSLSVFSGNFINYGYWADVDISAPLTEADRTRSQADLYRYIARGLGSRLGVVAEIGCGIGVGTALVLAEFGPGRLYGVDRSAQQLARAAAVNAEPLRRFGDRLVFTQADASGLPWPDGELDAAYSVEAAQHIDDLTGFATELHRVLRPGGRLAIATFFSPDTDRTEQLAPLLETVASGVDRIRPVGELTEPLARTGFTDVRAESIGAQVWPGLDAWIAGTEYGDSWARNWYTAWQDGWIDYYLVSAVKPGDPHGAE